MGWRLPDHHKRHFVSSKSLIPTNIEIGGRNHKVGFEQNIREQLEDIIPMRRPGTAEEAAGALYLFCLPESDYITGEIITAGGGLLSY